MWKLGIHFLMHGILTSSENVQNHFHRLSLHSRSQTKLITEFSLMYGITILFHNYWFPLPVDMFNTHADAHPHARAHTHTHVYVHRAWCCRRKTLIWHVPYFLDYTEQFFLKKVSRNWNVHLINDKVDSNPTHSTFYCNFHILLFNYAPLLSLLYKK